MTEQKYKKALKEICQVIWDSEPVQYHPETGEKIGRRPVAQQIVDIATAAIDEGAEAEKTERT